MELSHTQEVLVSKLKGGAMLHHEPNGKFRLHDGAIKRTIHPTTVDALIRRGVLFKALSGHVLLESP